MLYYSISDKGHVCAIRLTIDHKPEVPTEKERVEKQGGVVYAENEGEPYHIYMHEDNNIHNPLIPILPLSRSIGNTIAKEIGVISEPEFFSYTFHKNNKHDLAIVIGSDGLWAFMTDEEVMNTVVKTEDPTKAVDTLLQISQERWFENEHTSDDITICVLYISPPPPPNTNTNTNNHSIETGVISNMNGLSTTVSAVSTTATAVLSTGTSEQVQIETDRSIGTGVISSGYGNMNNFTYTDSIHGNTSSNNIVIQKIVIMVIKILASINSENS